MAFTIYTGTALFPVRRDATNSTNTTVGSQVVSALVAGISDGTRLDATVRYSLRLTNAPTLGTNEVISDRRCVFWDYHAAGKIQKYLFKCCIRTKENFLFYQLIHLFPPLQVVVVIGTAVDVT